MAELFATSKQTISYHVINILKENELTESSVVKEYLTTAADGKSYNIVFYSLEMIIAVGYRVRGVRGTQFRQWATRHLSEYLVKGFVIDDERLKNPDDRLNRLVDIFLTSAEMRVEGRRDLTLDYWRKNVDNLLQFQGMDVLQGKGSVSNAEMESYVKNVYASFDAKRKQQEAQQADADDLKLLEDLERKIINQNKSNKQ